MLQVIKQAGRHFMSSGGMIMASHVAMSLMLAIFPFLIFAVALSVQIGAENITDEMIDLTIGTWPDNLADPIRREIEVVVQQSGPEALTVSALLMMFFASNGVDAIRMAMLHAYGDPDRRSFLRARGLCLIFVVLGAGVMIIVSLLLVAIPLLIAFMADQAPNLPLGVLASDWARSGVAAILLILALYACHHYLPTKPRSAGEIWPGVLVTLVAWLVTTRILTLYLINYADYAAIYAGLAGVMATMIYLNLMSAILIFGAEFNGALIAYREGRLDADEPEAAPSDP